MPTTDVPQWPLYRLTADDDQVTVTGPGANSGPYPTRDSALAAVAVLAATLRPPRSVRAQAADEDGRTIWPLLVHPDGTVTEDGSPTRTKTKAKKLRRQAEGQVEAADSMPEAPSSTTQIPAAREAGHGTQPAVDPHEAIRTASQAGRHGEAAAVAAEHELTALRQYGAQSPEVAHWIEVRAYLAQQAEDPVRACHLWLQAAVVRLNSGQDPQHPEVTETADRAHAAWHLVTDPRSVRDLGSGLQSLRARVPGRRGARADIQTRLTALTTSTKEANARGR
ncbi:hypothetical protein ACJBCE_37065 [Streptomyces sp. NBUL23]|uniref:hypothetical protein n=1 Tax=Streptomyces sp. NBUL23 TaxID=3381354 RepID=UPI0038712C9F